MVSIPLLNRRSSNLIASAVALSEATRPEQPKGFFTAASQRLAQKIGWKKNTNSSWSELAWNFYDDVPELHFAANWIGRAMSQGVLYAGEIQPDGSIGEAPDGHPAHDVVAQIAESPVGRSQFLQAFGPQLAVAGEAYVAVVDGQWWVLSNQELRAERGRIVAEVDGQEMTIRQGEAEGIDAFRIWKPHPRRRIEADSPVRASLGVLDELGLLGAAVQAIAKSRVAGRGILLVPQGIRPPTTPGQSDAQDDALAVLQEAMSTAIRDPDSAAATVPLMFEVPKEAIAEIKHIKFESEFDKFLMDLRQECIRRFAAGIELPAEYLLGLGGTNHWSLWALSEEAIKAGVEPHLATVCDGLTREVLWPILDSETAKNFVVWYDTSKLRSRASKAQTALELWDRGIINDEALRRESGFSDDDADLLFPQGLPTGRRRGPSAQLPVSETHEPPAHERVAREAR
ncbi:hypothetical protein [Phytoactinopolyspora mesophila]|uniref:Phage portal protein n=1 Tax=Phytoactinopolyspora mesophila TaxID=2650750 RepID=A0A7K3M5N2_9ACTN|nr:hypothetical protein [Phytoactinopolyspora mesophila]NDL58631.1 hypothetical protein [Phytoactinopolyspora mesophila]